MSSNKKGRLVLYSGSSGVGKGTVLKKVMASNPNVVLSVSDTTRAPREGEVDGVHYNFITREEFERKIAEGAYLEHAEYCDNYYGTPKRGVEELIDKGFDVILEIEVQGGLQIMEKYPGLLSIFIIAPSSDILRQRLENRGTEDAETVKKRLDQAMYEAGFKNRYKHVVVNDDLDLAVERVIEILNSSRGES